MNTLKKLKLSFLTLVLLGASSIGIYLYITYFPYTGNWKKFGAADENIFTDGYYTVTIKYPPNWSIATSEPGIMARNSRYTFDTGLSGPIVSIQSSQVRLESDNCEYYDQYTEVECTSNQDGVHRIVTAQYYDAETKKFFYEIGHHFPHRTIRYIAVSDSKRQMHLLKKMGDYFELTISPDFDAAYALAMKDMEVDSTYQNTNIYAAGLVRSPVDISYDVWNQLQISEFGINFEIPQGYYYSPGLVFNRIHRNDDVLFTVSVINSYILKKEITNPDVDWKYFLAHQPSESPSNSTLDLSWGEYHHIKDTFQPNSEINGVPFYIETNYGKVILKYDLGEDRYYFRAHAFIQNGLNYVRITFPINITDAGLDQYTSNEIVNLLNGDNLPLTIQQQKDLFYQILNRFTVDEKF